MFLKGQCYEKTLACYHRMQCFMGLINRLGPVSHFLIFTILRLRAGYNVNKWCPYYTYKAFLLLIVGSCFNSHAILVCATPCIPHLCHAIAHLSAACQCPSLPQPGPICLACITVHEPWGYIGNCSVVRWRDRYERAQFQFVHVNQVNQA